MTKTMLRSALLGITVFSFAATSFGFGTLKIGAEAPKVKVAKWLKGKATNKFEKNKTYVVEFWATWCGPCKESIPHLNQMANGEFNNKVQFIGVSVWERGKGEKGTAYQAKVKDFVDKMGSDMNYTIAVDGEDDYMSTNWLKAAGQNGIPSSFIVHDGKVAWIGHPMMGLDTALREILAGTYDFDGAAKKMEAKAAKEAEMNEFNMKLKDLVAKGDFKAAVEAYDGMMANSEMEPAQIAKSRAMFYNQIAWEALTGKQASMADKTWVLDLAEKAMVLSDNDPLVMDTCALANFKTGNKARAIELQEIAVQKVKGMEGVDEATIKEMIDRLAEFKKG